MKIEVNEVDRTITVTLNDESYSPETTIDFDVFYKFVSYLSFMDLEKIHKVSSNHFINEIANSYGDGEILQKLIYERSLLEGNQYYLDELRNCIQNGIISNMIHEHLERNKNDQA